MGKIAKQSAKQPVAVELTSRPSVRIAFVFGASRFWRYELLALQG